MDLKPHDFDYETVYCTRCGTAMQQFVETLQPCADDVSNVVVVSCIIARRRFREFIGHLIIDAPP